MEDPDRPAWQGPPADVPPRRLAHQIVLAQTDAAVLVAERFAVYPSGFEFTVRLSGRLGRRVAHFDLSLMWAKQLRDSADDAPPEIFRLELQFSDDSRANYAAMPQLLASPAPEPPGPVLFAGAGHGHAQRGESEQHYWVWPLPPSGPLVFRFAWPANDIPLTCKKLDAALFLTPVRQTRPLPRAGDRAVTRAGEPDGQ